MTTQNKLNALEKILQEMGSVLVAYSGGVDSAFLAYTAKRILGEKSLTVFANSILSPVNDLREAEVIALDLGLKFRVVDINVVDDNNVMSNSPERCYYCKLDIYGKLFETARLENVSYVIDGFNADDVSDYRPGRKAGIELGVRSPLNEAGLDKTEIRELSRKSGLPTWNKAASPCMASRIPYGYRITEEVLNKISSAEEYLRSLGIKILRFRHHGDIARIEIGIEDMPLLINEQNRYRAVENIKSLGYLYVTMDLNGYKMGSLNDALIQREEKMNE